MLNSTKRRARLLRLGISPSVAYKVIKHSIRLGGAVLAGAMAFGGTETGVSSEGVRAVLAGLGMYGALRARGIAEWISGVETIAEECALDDFGFRNETGGRFTFEEDLREIFKDTTEWRRFCARNRNHRNIEKVDKYFRTPRS